MYLSNLSPLMQRTIAIGITFMISQSGIAGYYNLYFAKHPKTCRMIFDEVNKVIYHSADETHAMWESDDINKVLRFVVNELKEDISQ